MENLTEMIEKVLINDLKEYKKNDKQFDQFVDKKNPNLNEIYDYTKNKKESYFKFIHIFIN
jgi:Zn-finger nucleic acid-binding protein